MTRLDMSKSADDRWRDAYRFSATSTYPAVAPAPFDSDAAYYPAEPCGALTPHEEFALISTLPLPLAPGVELRRRALLSLFSRAASHVEEFSQRSPPWYAEDDEREAWRERCRLVAADMELRDEDYPDERLSDYGQQRRLEIVFAEERRMSMVDCVA